MNENTKVKLFSNLVSGKDILPIFRLKKKSYLNESILETELDHYLSKGWEIDKEFKCKIKIKKDKSIDIFFEDYVWCLFSNMGFSLLNKDRNFKIPYDKVNPNLTQQIDVFAKDEETILLIECKSALKNRKGDFKKDIEAIKGRMEGINSTLRSLFPEKKYKIKYILATKNYSISEIDAERLEKMGGIHMDDDSIEYFYSLYSQIGKAAKYQLLGNLFDGKNIVSMDNKVPAVQGTMGGFKYYSFSIEPEKILKLGYVLHRNKANINMMPTYQRLIKKSRLTSVRNFIDNGGYFPNSIVISIDDLNPQFDQANTQVPSTKSNVGILHLPKRYRSVYIIDGQHRLYGYSDSEYRKTNTIPVVAFINLDREDQIKLFMQINENQKAVSKDLRNTLNADLLWTSPSFLEQQKALCSRISIFLGEDRRSPLYGCVSIGEDKKIITTQAIENALKKSDFLGKVTKTKVEELGLIYNGDLDYTFNRLKDYLLLGFNYLYENLTEEWERNDNIILINKGIYSIIRILSDIMYFLDKENIVNSKKDSLQIIFSEVKNYLDPVIQFFKNIDSETENDLRTAYGANGDTKYWRMLQYQIQDTHNNFIAEGLDEYLLKEEKRFNNEAINYIRDIEIFFKSDFKIKLEYHFGKNWFLKGVPPKIANDAMITASAKNREVDDLNENNEVEPWDCLNIIAYREIASKNWKNIFEKEYTFPGEEGGNIKKDNKTKWMVNLEQIRNQNFHNYSVTEEELSFLNNIHDWLITKEVRNKFQGPGYTS